MRPDEDAQRVHVVAGDVEQCMLRPRMSERFKRAALKQWLEKQKTASRDSYGGTNERR